MRDPGPDPYPLGDLLALARQSWIARMAMRLATLGYPGYRGTDAVMMRILRSSGVPIGELGPILGMSRQAARNVVKRLESRGYVTTQRNAGKPGLLTVSLTPTGEAYAQAVIEVIDLVDHEVSRQVGQAQLVASDAVLRAVLHDDDARHRAARLVHPPQVDDEGQATKARYMPMMPTPPIK